MFPDDHYNLMNALAFLTSKAGNAKRPRRDELICVNGYIQRCFTRLRWLTIPLLTGPDVEQLR